MTTELNPVDKWKSIPWRKLRKIVFRLQVRIFKAQKNGNTGLVRKLQKILLNSKAVKLLAIRQVFDLSDTGQTLFPRVQLMFNLDYLPIRVAPISGLFSSSSPQLHFQSLFSVYVGRFGITPFLAGETCLLKFDALTLI